MSRLLDIPCRRSRPLLLLVALTATVLVPSSAALAQQVDQARGVDSRVDYRSLVRFGPWDDRNYRLTADDVALLADDEERFRVHVPAFYRIEIRRLYRDEGLDFHLYPRSALPRFLLRSGGYLVNGSLYRRSIRAREGYRVRLDTEDLSVLEFLLERTVATESRITSPTGAAESAVAIHPTNPALVIAGSNGPGAGQVMHYSTDGGATWTSAGSLASSCCDPTVAWSSDGTKAYTATLGTATDFYVSNDSGQNWGSKRVLDLAGTDKEYMHVDVSPTSSYKDNIYLTWHRGNTMKFARSTDFGDTWSSVTAFGSAPLGIGSDVTTDRNGKIYYFYPAFGTQQIIMIESTDGGASFFSHVAIAATQGSFIFPVPSMEQREVFIYVSADTDRTTGPFSNSVYAAWTDSSAATDPFDPDDNHARIQVAYSRDGGDNWTVTTPHETVDIASVDRYHQWLAVGPDGTVHVVFYDTGFSGDRTSVDFAHTYSMDGGQTWSPPERLTSASSPNIGNSFEFGDYNGLDVVMNDLIAVFTDNRSEAPRGGDSVDVYAARRDLDLLPLFADGFESGTTSAWAP